MRKSIVMLAFELPATLPGGIASLSQTKIDGFVDAGYRVFLIGPTRGFRGRRSSGVIKLPIPARKNLLKFLLQAVWALLSVPLCCPKFVYALSGTYCGLTALLMKRLYRVRYVVCAYGNEFVRFERSRLVRPVIRAVYANATTVIAISNFTAGEVRRIFGPPTVHIIQPGVDPDRFAPASHESCRSLRERYHVPDTATIITTVSRMDERKGHDTVLRSLSLLSQRGVQATDILYLIAGKGPNEPNLRALVAELGLQPFVRFAGFVPSDLVPVIYTAANLFVMPSRHYHKRGNVEGFGLVFVEAGLCGTASIGSRSGGISDAISEGVTGFTVDSDDPVALANYLTTLIDKPAHFRDMGEAARRYYLKNLTSQAVAQKETALFQELGLLARTKT